MQSNWLDATLHISPEELRVIDWADALMIPEDELDLTNETECDIIKEREFEWAVEKLNEKYDDDLAKVNNRYQSAMAKARGKFDERMAIAMRGKELLNEQ